ncbi:MAG: hypothetical protein H6872_09365 [Methylobacteriaceae bacterium]|nr:hypothetical protein [Methylobacteriaceae bacterium]
MNQMQDAGRHTEGEKPRAREPISLTAALRRARLESAERGDAQEDLMGAAIARLDLLREQLEPVFAQLPGDCDLFDLGLIQGEKPRLFVDMIAFVELTRDRRGFRFLQDTRNGRVLIAESEQMDAITQAVADYLARRLIEREKALTAAANPAIAPLRAVGSASAPASGVQSAPARPPRERRGFLRVLARVFAFVIEVIGSAVFFGLLAAGAWWLWKTYLH